MVLLSVPDKLIVMTYLCQIRAFCTGQELQLVQLEGGGGSGTYRVGNAQPSLPDGLDAGNLAQRLREHGAEAPTEPKEAVNRGAGAAPKVTSRDMDLACASKDGEAEATQEAVPPEAPSDGPRARSSTSPVAPTEGLVNGVGAPGGMSGVRLRRSSVNGEAGPVPPPRAHGSFSHVRDADLLKKRRSRLRNSNSFSVDDPDSGAAVGAGPAGAGAVVSTPTLLQLRIIGGFQRRVPNGPNVRAGAGVATSGRSLRAGCWDALRSDGPWCCGRVPWYGTEHPVGGTKPAEHLDRQFCICEWFLTFGTQFVETGAVAGSSQKASKFSPCSLGLFFLCGWPWVSLSNHLTHSKRKRYCSLVAPVAPPSLEISGLNF